MTLSPRSALLLALASVVACDRPSPLPDMGLSASAVVFEAPAASGDPLPQSVYVTNTGAGSLARPSATIAYQDGAGWLSAKVTGSGAPYEIRLGATVGTLAPGAYRATVTLASANASSSPLQVAATLDVPDPRFALSTASLAFAAPRGGGRPPPQEFQVTNGGRGLLPVPQVAVSYVGAAGWLSTVVGGTPDAYTVTTSADVTGLASGTYSATITLTAAGGAAPPTTMGVSLTVPPPELAASPPSILFRAEPNSFLILGEYLQLTNSGGGFLAPATASVTYDDPRLPAWLTPTPWHPLWFFVRAAAMVEGVVIPTGTHWATLWIHSEGAANSPLPIRVKLVVPPAPIAFSSTSVSFTPYAGCPLPLPQQITVTCTGVGTQPAVTATVDAAAAGWLVATAQDDPTTRKSVVTIRVTGRPPPTASATVTISAPGAIPDTQAIQVTYAEQAAPPLSVGGIVPPIRRWQQLGAGDLGAIPLMLYSPPGGCLPVPEVAIAYPVGTAPWLTSQVQTDVFGRHHVSLLPSAAGMASGDLRKATVTFPNLAALGAGAQEIELGAGAFSPAGAMNTVRSGHTITALEDGRALAAGGFGWSAEIFDPVTRSWTLTGALTERRSGHGAVLLGGNRVLVCGGGDSTFQDTCEIWAGGAWSAAGTLLGHHYRGQLLLMNDGKVLIVSPYEAPEIFDPVTGTSILAGAPWARGWPAVRLWSNIESYLVMGAAGQDVPAVYLPSSGSWSPTKPFSTPSWNSTLLPLEQGILALFPGSASEPYAWLWDPRTDSWSQRATPGLLHGPATAVVLQNGQVLGLPTTPASDVELYDPVTNTWSVPVTLPSPRGNVATVVLSSGMVLMAGGQEWVPSPPAGMAGLADSFTW